MPLPTFLIVGVPRAGTTSLAAYLAAHPDVLVATGKELHFFNDRHARGLDWYSRQFEGKPGASQRGEATPGYLFRADAVERMGRALPEAKLIVVLREPVDRAYSHYWLNRWRGIEPLSFPEALAAEPERRAARPGDPRRAYFGMGCYVEQLTRLLSYYPTEQVHTTFFEDLARRPAEVVLDICRFLGVEEVVQPVTGQRHNHHGPIRSHRVAALSRKLPGPLCRAVRDWNTRPGEYPHLDEQTRGWLADRFGQANEGLGELIGRAPPWAVLAAGE